MIFVMVKCCVLFEVRTGLLNITEINVSTNVWSINRAVRSLVTFSHRVAISIVWDIITPLLENGWDVVAET
jgi:hypothetical protein